MALLVLCSLLARLLGLSPDGDAEALAVLVHYHVGVVDEVMRGELAA